MSTLEKTKWLILNATTDDYEDLEQLYRSICFEFSSEFYNPSAVWTRADFGDGGYSLIDQSAVNTTNVNMYHTYFNASTLQGYGFVATTVTATAALA